MTSVTVIDNCCGFTTTVRVSRVSRQSVMVRLCSGCKMVTACEPDLKAIAWAAALNPRSEQWLHRTMFSHIRHMGCLIPSAVAKAIEVEIGASLPKGGHLVFHDSADTGEIEMSDEPTTATSE